MTWLLAQSHLVAALCPDQSDVELLQGQNLAIAGFLLVAAKPRLSVLVRLLMPRCAL